MRQTTNRQRNPIAKALASFAALLFLAALSLAPAARADVALDPPSVAQAKLSTDLSKAITANSVSGISWARESSSGRLVKVLVISTNTTDSSLSDLRHAVVASGGAVYYKYISVNGLLAMLPAARVLDIARRSDVESISPNRMTARTSSLVEKSTGAAALRAGTTGTGFTGAGIGIAFLDSGIMASHGAFAGTNGKSRVKKSVDLTRVNESALLGLLDWKGGLDFSKLIYPGSSALNTLESTINSSAVGNQDPYGHGTLVASLAAGRAVSTTTDSTGVAPSANLYDVRVLDGTGIGDVGDALAGMDWVILHKDDYGIRVVNISLAADSTESYLTDPLCLAVRHAVASGLVVVVAAGNYGLDASGREQYGGITSPGNEPSAITVGSANPHDTASRADDTVNMFSSRGPTLGGDNDANGAHRADSLLKPDLVAPGNRLVGALATDNLGLFRSKLAVTFPQLVVQAAPLGKGLMVASGTSFSAPVVSGTVALMLQANPGLTPPLVKAILQYTAEPLVGYNLLEQGAGMVNDVGAVQVAQVLQSNISTRVANGSINVGDGLLAAGQSLPSPSSNIDGRLANWSRIAYLGGNQVLTGDALLTRFQAPYDPTLSWVGPTAFDIDIDRFANNNAYISGFDEALVGNAALLSAGVGNVATLLGSSSSATQTGAFMPTLTVSQLAGGSPVLIGNGVIITEGVILTEGVIFTEGVILTEGVMVTEGVVVTEGVLVTESVIVTEQGPMPGE